MPPKSYVETMTDVRKAIREEVDAERRAKLQTNLDRIESEHVKMQETITTLRIAAAGTLTADAVKAIAESGVKVLTERVDSLTYTVRGIIGVAVLQIVGGVTLAMIVHSLWGK